jgi:hypothetical protein
MGWHAGGPARRAWQACALGGAAALAWLGGPAPAAHPQSALEVVAVGVPRPLQIIVDGRALVILSPGTQGDSAGEIYRVDLDGELPVDLSRQPRVRIPFADARTATLGSLALDPASRQLFLGEENGSRIYQLAPDERLTVYATGLHRLPGGSPLAFDARGRLVIVDHVDPGVSRPEERAPPGLEQFREDDYRGPLVFRLALEPGIPLPRRLDRLAPSFPRAWGGRQGGALLPRLISVAPLPTGDLALLSSTGELFRLAADGTLGPFARLPPGHGQYNRINMIGAGDGSVFVSGGFHVARIFRVAPDGAVTTVAGNLADPEGIALEGGYLYVAESAFHRIVRRRLPER